MTYEQDDIARGAELLDKVRPGWELQLDLGELDVNSCFRCVLGQVFAPLVLSLAQVGTQTNGYDLGIMMLCGDDGGADIAEWARDHGFAARRFEGYKELTEGWRQFVKDRLDQGITIEEGVL